MRWLSKQFLLATFVAVMFITGIISCTESPLDSRIQSNQTQGEINVVRITMAALRNSLESPLVITWEDTGETKNDVLVDLVHLNTNEVYDCTVELFTRQERRLINITSKFKDIDHEIRFIHTLTSSLADKMYIKIGDVDKNGQKVGFHFAIGTFGQEALGELNVTLTKYLGMTKAETEHGNHTLFKGDFPVTIGNN